LNLIVFLTHPSYLLLSSSLIDTIRILPRFDLYACVNHFGTAGAGHYTAHVRRDIPTRTNVSKTQNEVDDIDDIVKPYPYLEQDITDNGKTKLTSVDTDSSATTWLYCNDSDVGTASTAPGTTEEQRKSAYVLFYRRKGLLTCTLTAVVLCM